MDVDDPTEAIRRVRAWGAAELTARSVALLERAPLFDLEVASACNVVCAFCPRGSLVRGSRLMEPATFDAVLSFLPEGSVAMLSGLGDPLLHPRLPEFVARLVARGVSSCVITNGVRLTPERQDALIEAGVAELQVSVQGLEDGAVRRVVTAGADPEAVRRQVERLAAQRGPRVRINYVETPSNSGERERVEAWALGLGARFFHRRLHTRGGTVAAPRDDGPCPGCGIFASVTFVTCDGEVLPCVNDVRAEGRLGNVRDLTWAEVVRWKRSVLERADWFAPCASCDDDYRWVLLASGGP